VSDNIDIASSVFYGTCPAYLTNIVEPAGAGRIRSGLRSTSFTNYTLPRLRTKFAERAFSYAGPSAWNGLSEDLRAVADPAEFRKHLKTHFFTAAHNVYWRTAIWNCASTGKSFASLDALSFFFVHFDQNFVVKYAV